jgi:iron(III) transport system ATP-binding protein
MLTLEHLDLAYGDTRVLDDISLRLKSGEIGCVLGPSGCGKSTLLQAIAGFHAVKSGRILINQQIVSDANTNFAPDARGVGVVFQDFALFPHMSIIKNVEYGLHKLHKTQRHAVAREHLALVGLEAYENAYPHELSGGQQQRAAIARAVAPRPRLLLLDEPFSSLDPELRERVAVDIRNLIKRLGITALLVTHDQNEAFAMADKIGIFAQHRCQQWDSAYRLYHEPNTRFVANFIGEGTFISGEVQQQEDGWYVNTQLGRLALERVNDTSFPTSNDSKHSFVEAQRVDVLVRPDDILHQDSSPLKAKVIDRRFRGAQILYRLMLPNFEEQVLCLAPSHHDHHIGESFGIRLSIEHVICFAREGA